MKSSAVSLLNVVKDPEKGNIPILLNLIDTPGHIDFSTEVGAALRVCDGAVVLVDLAEGVCVQTRECIKKAMQEKAQMVLVLNKFDRLIVEMRLDVNEIFNYILRAIEICNVIVAEMYQLEYPDCGVDVEDSGFLFSPDTGNVIFASAIHGWGFTLKQLSRLFLPLVIDETVDTLTSKLWNFDCYVDQKKTIRTGAVVKGKDNLFKQFCIKTILAIYETIVIRMDKLKVNNILQKLGITTPTKDMLHNDPKIQIKAIMQAWKPIAETILLQCFNIFGNPGTMSAEKTDYLLNVTRHPADIQIQECIKNIKPHIENPKEETETVAYVSKMFCMDKKNASGSKIVMPAPRATILEKQLNSLSLTEEKPNVIEEIDKIQVIALTRLFTGTLKVGQEIYVLDSNYRPGKDKHVEKVVIKNLYMFFGKDVMDVDSVPPGNFCGVGGLETSVIRTATLSTTLNMVPFYESPALEPVIRNSIEPANPKDLPVLREGLKLLMQSDSCVQVMIQENGEMVLLTAGDVHLAKCIEDLTKKFTNIAVNVSSPMVALRETVLSSGNDLDYLNNVENYMTTQNDHLKLSAVALQIPENIMKVLKRNYLLLRDVEDTQKKSLIDMVNLDGQTNETVLESLQTSIKAFKDAIAVTRSSKQPVWKHLEDTIWSIGRNSQCINVLVNKVKHFGRNIFTYLDAADKRLFFDHCVVNAFDTVCKAGPLCEEPLMNVAFVITEFELLSDVKPEEITPQFASGIEGMIRNVLRKSFDKRERRLMEPMFTTDIQVNTNILGKVYSVVSKRCGKVLDAVGMDEEEKVYLVKAQIPVIESIGFANEIRTATSGQANPNLKFSHYEVIDGDPFYEPVEEDDEDESINVESAIRASKIRKDVRTRKGLYVEDQVVTHAEKQRTLNKKK